jgi:integrase
MSLEDFVARGQKAQAAVDAVMLAPRKSDTSLVKRPGRQLAIRATRATGDVGDLPVYVTRDEIQRARAFAGPDVGALIGFLWATGARISEALVLTVRDLDVELGAATLPTLKRRRKDGSGRKVSVRRVVPVAGQYLSAVLGVAVKLRRGADDRIWQIDRKWAWRCISKALQRAGVERPRATVHAIRHGHAVHAVLNHVPLNLIQRQLGHASIVTTAIYLRVTAQDVREAYGRFEW